jgi:hypothetical protein
MPADSDRTAYQSGDAPQGSTGSGSAPHASSSITSELPPRAWSKRSSTLSVNGVVHGGGSTPSASNTISVPSRLSPRSYTATVLRPWRRNLRPRCGILRCSSGHSRRRTTRTRDRHRRATRRRSPGPGSAPVRSPLQHRPIGRRGTQVDAPPRRFGLLDVYIDRLIRDGRIDDVVACTGQTGVGARERLPGPDGHHV